MNRFSTQYQSTNPFLAQSGVYRYGFNGEEQSDEIATIGAIASLEFRFEDVRLGRFLSVDPLHNRYCSQSSYAYAGNCPIAFIDFRGLGPDCATDNEQNDPKITSGDRNYDTSTGTRGILVTFEADDNKTSKGEPVLTGVDRVKEGVVMWYTQNNDDGSRVQTEVETYTSTGVDSAGNIEAYYQYTSVTEKVYNSDGDLVSSQTMISNVQIAESQVSAELRAVATAVSDYRKLSGGVSPIVDMYKQWQKGGTTGAALTAVWKIMKAKSLPGKGFAAGAAILNAMKYVVSSDLGPEGMGINVQTEFYPMYKDDLARPTPNLPSWYQKDRKGIAK